MNIITARKLICLVFALFALLSIALAYWGSNRIGFANGQIRQGLDRAETGIASKNWSEIAAGVDAVHWGERNLYVSKEFEGLGLFATAVSVGLAFVLLFEKSRIQPPNKALQPTPMSFTDRAAHAPRQP